MQITLQKALSFYLTGSTALPTSIISTEQKSSITTREEADDLETTIEEHKKSNEESVKFKNQTLNLEANLNTVDGQFRQAGLGAIGSFFSAIGAGIGSKLTFSCGLGLAGLSFCASLLKNVPHLSTKYKYLSLGGNLIRSPLRILDSIFSLVGEQGSKFTIPSLSASLLGIFSLNRIFKGKDNKSAELPLDTISGTLGRAAGHHFDSMLASKAVELSSNHQNTSAFLATSVLTSGLLLKDELKKKEIPWNTFEGYIAQGNINFLDSLFSGIGKVFSTALNNSRNIAIGASGIILGMPLLGSIINSLNYTIPFGTFEGKLVQSIFRVPESFAFNLGNVIGNSNIGLPLSIGFIGLTSFACLSKPGHKLIRNIEISKDSLAGQFQKLPLLHFMYSVISSAGVKLSNFVPAPLLLLFGPALSFQIGEKLKNIPSKFTDVKGLMLRNSIHLWETIVTRAAYKTGRMVVGTQEEISSSGSVFGEHWLPQDGQIVDSMAIGKQMNEKKEANLVNILLSGLGGIVLSLGGFLISKQFMKGEKNNEIIEDKPQTKKQYIEQQKPISKPQIVEAKKAA